MAQLGIMIEKIGTEDMFSQKIDFMWQMWL